MKTKVCSRCKRQKRVTSFYRRGDGYQAYCKRCNNESRATYYQHNKRRYKDNKQALRGRLQEEVNEIKRLTPCADCGRHFPPCAMDFDHLEGATKVDTISNLVLHKQSRPLVLAEIEKCELVCACCHRVRTHNRRQKTTRPVGDSSDATVCNTV